jgi:hypothetical protein
MRKNKQVVRASVILLAFFLLSVFSVSAAVYTERTQKTLYNSKVAQVLVLIVTKLNEEPTKSPSLQTDYNAYQDLLNTTPSPTTAQSSSPNTSVQVKINTSGGNSVPTNYYYEYPSTNTQSGSSSSYSQGDALEEAKKRQEAQKEEFDKYVEEQQKAYDERVKEMQEEQAKKVEQAKQDSSDWFEQKKKEMGIE